MYGDLESQRRPRGTFGRLFFVTTNVFLIGRELSQIADRLAFRICPHCQGHCSGFTNQM